jgi:hypothetical protein
MHHPYILLIKLYFIALHDSQISAFYQLFEIRLLTSQFCFKRDNTYKKYYLFKSSHCFRRFKEKFFQKIWIMKFELFLNRERFNICDTSE